MAVCTSAWTSCRWCFGCGKRSFGPVDSRHLLEDPDVVIRGQRVPHLRYRVRR